MSDRTSRIDAKFLEGFLLTSQTNLAGKLLGLLGGIFLARWLSPEDFGVFAVVGFVVGILRLFVDGGFAASLIQKKDEVTPSELSSFLFFQTAIASLVMVFLLTTSDWVPRLYPAFKAEFFPLLYVFALVFLVDNLRSIPSSQWSREMQFGRLTRIEFAEHIVYWACVLFLAFIGFGVWALVVGLAGRSLVGLFLTFVVWKWRPVLSFSWKHIQAHLRFGIEYQVSRFLDFAKVSISPVVISSFFGIQYVGYVAWAHATASLLHFIVSAADRVGFVTLSRTQDNPVALRQHILNTARLSAFLVFPFLGGVFIFSGELIQFIYSEKWRPAETILRLYSIHFCLHVIAYSLYTCLLALGKNRIIMISSILAFFVEILTVLALKNQLGFESIAVAQMVALAVQFSINSYILSSLLKQSVNVVKASLSPALLTLASCSAIVLFTKMAFPIDSWLKFCVAGAAYCSVYLLLLRFFQRESFTEGLLILRRLISRG